MVALQADFPDIADDLLAAAGTNPALAEALDDYRESCRRLSDSSLSVEHRADWTSIRDELAEEIRRLFGLHRTDAST